MQSNSFNSQPNVKNKLIKFTIKPRNITSNIFSFYICESLFKSNKLHVRYIFKIERK